MSYRSIFTSLAVAVAGALVADDVPFVWNNWFTEDYSGLNATTWADTAGTWTRTAQDQSSLEEENGQRYLQVGAGPNDLKFTAPTSSGSYKPGLLRRPHPAPHRDRNRHQPHVRRLDGA